MRLVSHQFVWVSKTFKRALYLTALFILPLIPLSTTFWSYHVIVFFNRPFNIRSRALLALFSPNANHIDICAHPNAHDAAPTTQIPMTKFVTCCCNSSPDICPDENAPNDENIFPSSIVNAGIRHPEAIDTAIAGNNSPKSALVQNRYNPRYVGIGRSSSTISWVVVDATILSAIFAV
jgi:hypothetical protein